jgi:hypothetical protein
LNVALTLAVPDPITPPALTPPPNPAKPGRQQQARKGALILIKNSMSLRALPDYCRDEITAEVGVLAAQGVGPIQAAILLDRLDAPVLRAVDGGGKSTSRRARLALVPASPVLRLAVAS